MLLADVVAHLVRLVGSPRHAESLLYQALQRGDLECRARYARAGGWERQEGTNRGKWHEEDLGPVALPREFWQAGGKFNAAENSALKKGFFEKREDGTYFNATEEAFM